MTTTNDIFKDCRITQQTAYAIMVSENAGHKFADLAYMKPGKNLSTAKRAGGETLGDFSLSGEAVLLHSLHF